MPFAIALRDSPHARLTRLTPQWPNVIASLAAMRRRARSSINGHTARNFAVSLARLSTPGQDSTNHRKMVPSFLYGALLRVVETLGPSPAPPWVMRSSLPPGLRGALRRAFVTMHETIEGRAVLDMAMFHRFEAVTDHDYNPIRDMASIAASIQL